MLMSLSDNLNKARKEKYAVGCFNVVNMETVDACIECAEELKAPLIMAVAQVHLPFINLAKMVPYMVSCAHAAQTPVTLLLDHAYTEDVVKEAVSAGLNAVMYDISSCPYEEHVTKMKQMTDDCKKFGVQVEGELGYLGREQSGWDAKAEQQIKKKHKEDTRFTSLSEVEEYVQRTDIAALAVSIGNKHGQNEGAARLNFELLSSINDISSVPLVLHGSSGISDDDLAAAVDRGICKVNYYTGLSNAAVKAIRKTLAEDPHMNDYHPLIGIVKAAVKPIISKKMKVLGSNGRA